MERSNLLNHLLRLFDEGLSMKTTELEFGTLEVTVENRIEAKRSKSHFLQRVWRMPSRKPWNGRSDKCS